MELPFKFASVSTFVYATESEEKVRDILESIIPEGVEIQRSEAKGHHGSPIIILKARIDRRPHLREFWYRITEKLVKHKKEKLAETVTERIDDDCRLYLRLDKQSAADGKLVLTESGDALHVRINISAYPAKREIALEKMKKFVDSEL